ncbi:polysaccharide deacetylase family protein [Mycolicibacterium sp. 050158]|uniref:polysaccharide deacetylase family protein n=1 Tax=Mycolicibacterium sp. 050158 TaxID=3090602 RepID=UPI00299D689D|nr:polysaccharide deacetylase family protein [Mycolicibacterium sp. 050158]MDX1889950.1 polysaccharide deacetylase family protein [Mycolicibacterium sp. 050158]
MNASVPILMYHSVAEDPPASTRRLSVSPHAFAEQVALLAGCGFTAMTFSALADAFETKRSLPERPVVLTFDDGYADFAANAWPILKRHGFPATVFVTTGWMADAGPNAAGRPLDAMLDRAQVRALADAGIEIGAHSHSHPKLDQLSDVALRRELVDGRALLEEYVDAPVEAIAYPYGYSNRRVRLATQAAGYRRAAAVRNLRATPTDDLFRLPRLTIRRSTSQATFAAAVAGNDGRLFWRDRLMTAGWASVRGVRRAGRRVTQDV